MAADGVRPGLGCILQSCCGRWLSFYYLTCLILWSWVLLYDMADCLVGLVVQASPSRVADLGFGSHLDRDFSGSSHTSDFKIGTPVATLPGACRYRVSAGTGRPRVGIL